MSVPASAPSVLVLLREDSVCVSSSNARAHCFGNRVVANDRMMNRAMRRVASRVTEDEPAPIHCHLRDHRGRRSLSQLPRKNFHTSTTRSGI